MNFVLVVDLAPILSRHYMYYARLVLNQDKANFFRDLGIRRKILQHRNIHQGNKKKKRSFLLIPKPRKVITNPKKLYRSRFVMVDTALLGKSIDRLLITEGIF